MARWHWLAGIVVSCTLGPAAATPSLPDPANVAVSVQGRPGVAVQGTFLRGDAFIAARDLRALGLDQIAPDIVSEGGALVALSRLPGIGWSRVGAAQVQISIAAPVAPTAMRTFQLWRDGAALGEVRAVLHGGDTALFAADLRRLGFDPGPAASRLVLLRALSVPAYALDQQAGRITLALPAGDSPRPLAPAVVPPPAEVAPAAALAPHGPMPPEPSPRPAARVATGRSSGAASTGQVLPIATIGGDVRDTSPPGLRQGDESGALLVRVNGGTPRFLVRVTRRGEELLLRRADLATLGIRVPAGLNQLVELGSVAGLRWRILEAEQVLELDVPFALLLGEVLNVAAQPRLPVTPAATGAILTYDVEGQRRIGGALDGNLAAYGFLGATAFSPIGSVSMTALGRSGDRAVIPDPGLVRLDTTMQVDDPDRAWAFRLGDVLTGAAENRRRIRLGGAQWATDYLMRPDLVTYARPFISGSASVPSTVDLLINGVRTFASPVGAGPFELREIPAIVGPNALSVTVRDAQGLVSTRLLEISTSRRLLAEGTVEHSVEAGAIRRHYGFASNSYGQPAGSAQLRYGVSDRVTLASRLEGTSDFLLAGLGSVVSLGRAGSISFEPAIASRRGYGTGVELAGRWELTQQGYSASLGGSTVLGDFSDLANVAGDRQRRRMLNASLGIGLGPLGFAGMTIIDQKLEAQPGQRLALASYTTNIGDRGAVLGVNAFASLAGREERGLLGYVALPIGPVRTSVGAGYERGASSGRLTLEQPAPFEGGVGWRVATQEGALPMRQGELRFATPHAEYEVGAAMIGEEGMARGRVAGSVVALDGLHLRRNVPGSVALVETGAPGVRVLRENRPAGSTDDQGRLPLTGLQPYAENRISIDPLSLPMDATVPATTLSLVPPREAGVRGRFEMTSGGSALLRLRRADGRPVAQDAVVTDADGQEVGRVGLDGEVFLTGVAKAVTLLVSDSTGRCRVRVDLAQSGARIPVVATTCVAVP